MCWVVDLAPRKYIWATGDSAERTELADMTKFLRVVAIAGSAAVAVLGPQTAWGVGSAESGVLQVTSYQQVISHAYIEEFDGVYLEGTWTLPGATSVAELEAPGITVVSADLSTGAVQSFSARGTGVGGSLLLSCPEPGPATFGVNSGGAAVSVSFTIACSIEQNGGASSALNLSATIAMPPQEVQGVYPPTSGTFEN